MVVQRCGCLRSFGSFLEMGLQSTRLIQRNCYYIAPANVGFSIIELVAVMFDFSHKVEMIQFFSYLKKNIWMTVLELPFSNGNK